MRGWHRPGAVIDRKRPHASPDDTVAPRRLIQPVRLASHATPPPAPAGPAELLLLGDDHLSWSSKLSQRRLARRSDDTDARSGVAAGSALRLPRLVRR